MFRSITLLALVSALHVDAVSPPPEEIPGRHLSVEVYGDGSSRLEVDSSASMRPGAAADLVATLDEASGRGRRRLVREEEREVAQPPDRSRHSRLAAAAPGASADSSGEGYRPRDVVALSVLDDRRLSFDEKKKELDRVITKLQARHWVLKHRRSARINATRAAFADTQEQYLLLTGVSHPHVLLEEGPLRSEVLVQSRVSAGDGARADPESAEKFLIEATDAVEDGMPSCLGECHGATNFSHLGMRDDCRILAAWEKCAYDLCTTEERMSGTVQAISRRHQELCAWTPSTLLNIGATNLTTREMVAPKALELEELGVTLQPLPRHPRGGQRGHALAPTDEAAMAQRQMAEVFSFGASPRGPLGPLAEDIDPPEQPPGVWAKLRHSLEQSLSRKRGGNVGKDSGVQVKPAVTRSANHSAEGGATSVSVHTSAQEQNMHSRPGSGKKGSADQVVNATNANEEPGPGGSPGDEAGVDRKDQTELPGCKVSRPDFLGDGSCDSDGGYNTPECNYDGGDCCEAHCRPATFECGAAGYSCKGEPVFVEFASDFSCSENRKSAFIQMYRKLRDRITIANEQDCQYLSDDQLTDIQRAFNMGIEVSTKSEGIASAGVGGTEVDVECGFWAKPAQLSFFGSVFAHEMAHIAGYTHQSFEESVFLSECKPIGAELCEGHCKRWTEGCNTHFHYGSKDCGWASLGCQVECVDKSYCRSVPELLPRCLGFEPVHSRR